jgi:hypothetical protein
MDRIAPAPDETLPRQVLTQAWKLLRAVSATLNAAQTQLEATAPPKQASLPPQDIIADSRARITHSHLTVQRSCALIAASRQLSVGSFDILNRAGLLQPGSGGSGDNRSGDNRQAAFAFIGSDRFAP